jgi:hypothetical protein
MYDKFNYRYWGYLRISRNPRECTAASHRWSRVLHEGDLVSERLLRPKYLCVLNEGGQVDLVNVQRWIDENPGKSLEYIFVAWTAAQFNSCDKRDLDALHQIARRAVRAAGVPAYWISCSCMPNRDQVEDDVFRISDVVRGARSLVIAIGPPCGMSGPGYCSTQMLKQWGSRMWTFPEVLLSPSDHQIEVYVRGSDLDNPWKLSKRNFPQHAWDDADISVQLVEHYESSTHLSPLQLVTTALRCLSGRETDTWLPGDMSYVLMGLMNRRPRVHKDDTDFQAFARLSLANDSHQLLERLICTLPKHQRQHWSTIDDAWDVNLWDIEPTCQVAGIGEHDSVIIGGAFGAPIRWKSFAPVRLQTKKTAKRWVAQICLRGAPAWFVFGVLLVATSKGQPGMGLILGIGSAFLAVALASILASPYMLRVLYMGKSWGTQPWFFGFEGYADIETIETKIFGVYTGRLMWSPFGSELSENQQNRDGECIGIDPTTRRDLNEIATGNLKLFTLVDTYTMTVTLFRSVRPPVAILLCGSEGGMQRAVMCSYDWKTQTLYRETVLRMKTLVLEKMSRVDSLQLGLQRPPKTANPPASTSRSNRV